MTSAQLVYVISLMQQHVLTSKGHLQASGIKYIKVNLYNCNYVHWPEDDPLRLKHVAALEIQHKLVVSTNFIYLIQL
jgi:hypothetical protein